MASFKARELDVLVATTVIEVGVDVPNATIMIVQEADRFGLAQLHQLRGRVGRAPSSRTASSSRVRRDELSETAIERLEAMVATTDFELAEATSRSAAEGQLLGARQSGYSDLRFVRLRRDQDSPRARAHAARRSRRGPARRRRRPPARQRLITWASREDRRRLAEDTASPRPRAPRRVRRAIACARRRSRWSGPSKGRPCSTSSPGRARWASRHSPVALRAASSSSATATPRA